MRSAFKCHYISAVVVSLHAMCIPHKLVQTCTKDDFCRGPEELSPRGFNLEAVWKQWRKKFFYKYTFEIWPLSETEKILLEQLIEVKVRYINMKVKLYPREDKILAICWDLLWQNVFGQQRSWMASGICRNYNEWISC